MNSGRRQVDGGDAAGEHRFELPGLLTAKDVKKLIKASLPWVYKIAETGLLPSIRIPCPGNGKRKKSLIRFDPKDVDDFINKYRSSGGK